MFYPCLVTNSFSNDLVTTNNMIFLSYTLIIKIEQLNTKEIILHSKSYIVYEFITSNPNENRD